MSSIVLPSGSSCVLAKLMERRPLFSSFLFSKALAITLCFFSLTGLFEGFLNTLQQKSMTLSIILFLSNPKKITFDALGHSIWSQSHFFLFKKWDYIRPKVGLLKVLLPQSLINMKFKSVFISHILSKESLPGQKGCFGPGPATHGDSCPKEGQDVEPIGDHTGTAWQFTGDRGVIVYTLYCGCITFTTKIEYSLSVHCWIPIAKL